MGPCRPRRYDPPENTVRQRDESDDCCDDCRRRLRLLPPQTPTTSLTPSDLQAFRPGAQYGDWTRAGHGCVDGPPVPHPPVAPPLHGMRRLPDHHDGTPPHVCQHLQARCLNPPPLAHRASAAVGQWPRWSKTWVTLLRPVAHLSTASWAVFCPITLGGGDI